MAIHLETKTPRRLLTAFKKTIDDGHITTWSYDADGDFTHTWEKWNQKAWLRPRIIERTRLSLYIFPPDGRGISSDVYAAYHGLFIRSVLRYCDTLFSEARATAQADDSDRVGS